MMTPASSPLPTSSSIYRQMKFIIRTNITMKKVRNIGPRYDFNTSL